jgi:hypothetical protein
MDRREFFEQSGCGIFGMMLAYFGLKMPLAAEDKMKKKMTRQEYVKKLLMKKMGKTADEADKMIADFEKKLPDVNKMCICKGCPTYVKDEPKIAYCHPLVGQSKIIEKEKGCICGSCPVYKKMKMKFGYYCTRKSEMEQKMLAKMKKKKG